METQRKELLISRHGKKKGNSIIPESILRLYNTSGAALRNYVSQYRVSPSETFLRHSDQPRTLITGNAILAGAFQEPIDPTSESLDQYTIPGLTDVQTMKELSFNIKTLKTNEAAWAKDEAGYMNFWFANPDATEYEGVPITSYNEFSREVESGLTGPLGDLINPFSNKKAGVLVSHAGRTEGLLVQLANSGRQIDNTVKSLDEIGGPIPQEGYAILQVDCKDKSGLYESRLIRNGQEYPVNIRNLLE